MSDCKHCGGLVAFQRKEKYGVFACAIHQTCVPGVAGERGRQKGHVACEGCCDFEPRPGLGDAVERLLASIGVTQDRYKAAKEFCGLPPDCHCEDRKAELNAWTERVRNWLKQ